MTRLFILILIFVSVPFFFYGQDMPFMDGSLSSQQKADRYYNEMAYVDALKYYNKALEKSPDNAGVKLKMAHCYTQLRDQRSALKFYQSSMTSEQVTSQDMLNYADALAAHGDLMEAQKWYDAYHANTPNETISLEKKEKLKYIETWYEDSLAYFVKTVDFNSQKSDFSPAYRNTQILFVSNRASTGMFQLKDGRTEDAFLDIYQYDNGHLSLFDAIKKGLHQGPMTFYDDGKKLMITANQKESLQSEDHPVASNLKIVVYAETDGVWHYEGEFTYNNKDYSVGHPSVDQRNQILYFASNKPGGKGGSDLYASEYRDGKWSEPRNLESINTQGDELFPFISGEGDLYFASSGRGGLGGLDLFKTHVSDAKHAVYNLGYPINTPDDDFGLALDETGRRGYISSNRKNGMGGDDIYEITIFKIRVEAKYIDSLTRRPIKGGKIVVTDQVTGQEVPCEVVGEKVIFDALRGRRYKLTVEDTENGKQETDFETTSKEKFVAVDIPIAIKDPANKDGEKAVAEEPMKPLALVRFSNVSKVVDYQIGNDMLKEFGGSSSNKDTLLVEIKNLYFKFDSDEVRSGKEELEKIVNLMTKFQSINLEIFSYCDGFGSLHYNDELSKRRLKKVIAYLNEKGITTARIRSSAVGSKRLLNNGMYPNDCTVIENQRNRRVEFFLYQQ